MKAINIKKLGKNIPGAIVKKAALPAAVLSTTVDGNILEKVLKGTYLAGKIPFDIGKAIVTNEGMRDFAANASYNVLIGAGNLAKNMKEDLDETAVAAVLTYVGVKALPYLAKKAKNIYSNRKIKEDKQ